MNELNNRWGTGAVGVTAFVAGTALAVSGGFFLSPFLAAGLVGYGVDLALRSATAETPPDIISTQSAKAAVAGMTVALTGGVAAAVAATGGITLGTGGAIAVSAVGGINAHISKEITGNLIEGTEVNITPTNLLTSAAAGPASMIAGNLAGNTVMTFTSAAPNAVVNTMINATAGAAGSATAQTATNGVEVLTGRRDRSRIFEGVREAATVGATIGAATAVVQQSTTAREPKRKLEESNKKTPNKYNKLGTEDTKNFNQEKVKQGEQSKPSHVGTKALLKKPEQRNKIEDANKTNAPNEYKKEVGHITENTLNQEKLNTQVEQLKLTQKTEPKKSAGGRDPAYPGLFKKPPSTPTTPQVTQTGALEMINNAKNVINTKPPGLADTNFIANNIAQQCFTMIYGPDQSQWDWPAFDNLQGQLLIDQGGNGARHDARLGRTIFNFFGQPVNWQCHPSTDIEVDIGGHPLITIHR